MGRPLREIASEIRRDWKNVNYAAEPYLTALAHLDAISDVYFCDSGEQIVLYFLSNAGTWHGEVAKRIKAELRKIVDDYTREK